MAKKEHKVLRVSPEIHRQAKSEAAKCGMGLTEFTEQAILHYIVKTVNERMTPQPHKAGGGK